MRHTRAPKNKRERLRTLRNFAMVILGSFVLAAGTSVFIIPFELVTGGATGIGIILVRLFSDVPFLGTLTAETYVSFLCWLFFFGGLVFLGRDFAMKTLLSTIVYPIALSVTSLLVSEGIFGGFFDLTSPMYAEYGEIAVVLASVFGGALVGAGCALTFLGGGSTGGLDILALALCKYSRRLKSSVAVFVCDATVILLGVFAIQNLVTSLLGIVSAFVCAIAVDRIFIGESRAFTAQIISEKHEQINDEVISRLHRTTTVVDAVGGYSGERKKMVSVTFSMNQYAEFTALVASIDKNAFITVHRAHEINGEGWTDHDRTDSGP